MNYLTDMFFVSSKSLHASVLFMIFVFAFMMFIMFGGSVKTALIKSVLIAGLMYYAPVIFCGSLAFLTILYFMWSSLNNFGYSDDADANDRIDPRHTVAEYAPDGSIIGYRYFSFAPDGTPMSVTETGIQADGGKYHGGYKIADRIPTMKNTHGIYAAKTPDSPILKKYKYSGRLARVKLTGRVVEEKYGYRGSICEEIEFLE